MEQSPSWEANRFTASKKKIPAFYGTQRFITAFTSARHLSISWARSIKSMPPPPNLTSWSSILILSYLINRDIFEVYYKIRKTDPVPWLFLFVCRYVEYQVRSGITNRFEIKVDVWETDLEHLGGGRSKLRSRVRQYALALKVVTFRVLLPESWVGQFVRKEERVFCCLESSIVGAEGGVTIVLHIHYSLWSSYWSLSADVSFFFFGTWNPPVCNQQPSPHICWAVVQPVSRAGLPDPHPLTHGRVSSVRVLSVIPCAGRPPEWHSWFEISFVVYSEWDHFVDPRVDGRIILMWIFRQWEVGVWTGSSLLRIGTDGGLLWMR